MLFFDFVISFCLAEGPKSVVNLAVSMSANDFLWTARNFCIYLLHFNVCQFSFFISSRSISILPIFLLFFFLTLILCLLLLFFAFCVYSNIVPLVNFDFSSSIILILLPRLMWHMWQQKCINTKTKSCTAQWHDHYSRHYWILIMINIGVSFSIFLNQDDCQEYGQKENVLD